MSLKRSSAVDNSFENIRDHLDLNNSFEEAKSFLLNGENDKLIELPKAEAIDSYSKLSRQKTNTIAEDVKGRLLSVKNRPNFEKDSLLNALVSQKHSSALSLMKEEEEINRLVQIENQLRDESTRLEIERQSIAVALRTQKKEQLDTLEKTTQADLLELELQRAQMERDLDKRKSAIQKLQEDLKLAENEIDVITSTDTEVKANKSDNNNDERMKQIFQLAEDHAERLAESRTNIFVAQRDLSQIQQGHMPQDTSFLMNSRNDVDLGSEGSRAGESRSILTTAAQSIIDAVSSDVGYREQKNRIDMLRQNFVTKDESLNDLLSKNPNEVRRELINYKESARGISYEGIEAFKDRNFNPSDYLDMWLQEEKGANSSSSIDLKRAATNGNITAQESFDQLGSRLTNPSPSEETDQRTNRVRGVQPQETQPENTEYFDMINQLKDEIKQLKENKMSARPQQQANQQQYMSQGKNPSYPPILHPHYPTHHSFSSNPYGMPQQFLFPQAPPMPMPYSLQQQQPSVDPVQQMMVQQMQKIAEQIERENSKLMVQLGDPIQPQVGFEARPFRRPGGNVQAPPVSTKYTRIEQKHMEDIGLIKMEMERLKQQQELEELKASIQKQNDDRKKDLEYQTFLGDQKKELAQLKIKQAIAKEEKILKMHTAGALSDEADMPHHVIAEESGVGSKPMEVELINGVIGVADGILLLTTDVCNESSLYRLAAAIYDGNGKAICRLAASEWQPWERKNSATIVDIQFANSSIKRVLKNEDTPIDNGFRFLVEVQGQSETGQQTSVGWCVMDIAKKGLEVLQLSNGSWRVPIRQGIVNPRVANLTVDAAENKVGWILVRIADASNANNVNLWTPKGTLKNDNEVKRVYKSLPGDELPPNLGKNIQPLPTTRGESSKVQDFAKSQATKRDDPLPTNRPPSANVGAISSRNAASMNSRRESISQISNESAITLDNAANTPSLQEYLSKVEENSKTSLERPWISSGTCGSPVERYQKGDGVEFYIDSAMWLPDNCTFTRVVLKLFTSAKEPIGNAYDGYSLLASRSTSPVFNFKAEIRGSVINTTATALIRFDTIDCVTLQPVSIGYSVIKLFCNKDRIQCKTTSDNAAFVNTGSFQVPIYGGKIPNLDSFDDSMLSTLSKIPAASVLVRIIPAPKSSEGMSVLSREDFPQADWVKLKLDIPMPIYQKGTYDASACEASQTDDDRRCLAAKSNSTYETVDTAVTQYLTTCKDRPDANSILDTKPGSGSSLNDTYDWSSKILPPLDNMRKIIQFTFTCPYNIDSGISISIDSLYNVPDGSGVFSSDGITYKVIYSLIPPGLYYKDPPLSEGVEFTRVNDYEKPGRTPTFQDGFVDFFPPQLDESSFLILDVRVVRVVPSSGTNDPVITVEPINSKSYSSYWAILPIARERLRGQGFNYAIAGIYQLPLFEGSLPSCEIFSSSSPVNEIVKLLESKSKAGGQSLKLSDGASAIVRVCNPLLKTLMAAELNNEVSGNINSHLLEKFVKAGQKGISASRPEKFTYDAKKFTVSNGFKSATNLMPKGVDIKKIQKSISKVFAMNANLNE